MFDRYNEAARRAIFFARYEAGTSGSQKIETEHLLLGLLREPTNLWGFLPETGVEAFRKEVEETIPSGGERVSNSVDLPVSEPLKRVLEHAAEECELTGEEEIGRRHLLMGLLRVECAATDTLKRNGLDYEKARTLPPEIPRFAGKREERVAGAPDLQSSALRLESLVETAEEYLRGFSEAEALRPLKRESWRRIEALGHLLDWASAHHNWFALALTGPKLVANAYPAREFIAAQQYAACEWGPLVDLWAGMNRLLAHVLSKIPESKLETPCRIGINPPIPLSGLVAAYIEHCEDVLSEILARG
jgi:hypothetical protein